MGIASNHLTTIPTTGHCESQHKSRKGNFYGLYLGQNPMVVNSLNA